MKDDIHFLIITVDPKSHRVSFATACGEAWERGTDSPLFTTCTKCQKNMVAVKAPQKVAVNHGH